MPEHTYRHHVFTDMSRSKQNYYDSLAIDGINSLGSTLILNSYKRTSFYLWYFYMFFK